MVILRQERIFSLAGRGKFSECWMIIVYDTSGPSILLFKDASAKKAIFDRLHIPSLAAQIRFGSTCRPYGNLPEIKPDPKIDSSCLMAFQVERRVKKSVQTQVLWLCAESTKQMFGIMKILACGLTIMNFPAPPGNTDPNDINALHHYRPRILQPTNDWEHFWDNPPAARLVSPMELAKNVTKSMDALNAAVQQQQQEIPLPVETVVKSKSTPELETLARRHSTVSSHRTSTTSSRSSISRSLSGRRRSSKSVRVWELSRIQDMPRIPYTPQKSRKYERQESARSSPIVLRQIERQQKRIVVPETPYEEEEPIYIKRTSEVVTQPYEIYQPYEVQQAVKAVPPTPPPLPSQLSPVQKLAPNPVYTEIRHYDNPPEEDETEEDENCSVCHPPPAHHHHRPHHRRYHSVDRPYPQSPPQPILKRQLTKPPSYEQESPPQTKRPVSGYSSSAYGSGHVTPTHLLEQPPKKEFEVELLRRMSDLSLRPFSRTLNSPPYTHHEKAATPPIKEHYHEKLVSPPIKEHRHEKAVTPPIKEHYHEKIVTPTVKERRHHHHKAPHTHEKPPVEHLYDEVCHSPQQHEVYHSPIRHEVCHSPPRHEVCHSPQHEVCHSPEHEVCHSPQQHEVCHYPQHKEPEPKQISLLEQSAIPLKSNRRISDPEYLVKPRRVKRHAKHHRTYISQGVQTDHEPSDVPLIENFDAAPIKRFSFESHEPHLHHYQKMSQSTRSIYIQHLDEGNDYETVRPFFRTTDCSSSASECAHEEYEYNHKSKRHSHPILINDSLGTRTYTVEVDTAAGGLL